MNKKLVFAFYLAKNYKSEIVNIHFLCLKRFSKAFDSAEIVFILDKEYDRDNLLDAQQRFTEIFCGKPLSFSMVDNTPYREALVFQQYVVARMDEEELVFFAHNKGTTNVDKFDKEQIYTWVIAMYFYSEKDKPNFLKYLRLATDLNPIEAKNVCGELFPEDMQPQEYYDYAQKFILTDTNN